VQGIYEQLGKVSNKNVNLHILIKNKKTKKYGILTTEPTENIRKDLISSAKKQLQYILNKEYDEEEYCPVTTHSGNVINSIDVDQIPVFNDINNLIEGDLDFYNSNDIDSNTQIWAYIIIIRAGEEEETEEETEEEDIIMFQRCQPKKLLKPGKVLMILEKDNGHFSKFDDTLLTVDPQMDCICYNEKMYIFRKFYFEEIFGLIDKFGEEIKSKLDDIPQEEVLVNLNDLAKFCSSDKHKEKKLYKILNDGGFDLLTEENIKQLNDSHNLGLKMEEGKIQLTPTATKNVLNLMNKDCVDDTITDEPYVAISKTPIKPSS
jgi:hypothetical protein